MAKEKQPDTWGNVKASKYNQKGLERQRKKRMQELNTQNGVLGEQVKNLQNQKLDLEDTIVHLIESRKDVEEDLLVARAEVVNLKRSLRKIEKANPKVEPQVLLEFPLTSEGIAGIDKRIDPDDLVWENTDLETIDIEDSPEES